MRILRGVLLLLLPLAGCSYLVTRPDNTLAPTASLGRRIAEYGRPKSVKDEWIKSLVSELNQMDGWSPPCDWYTNDMAILTAAMGPGAKEYGFDLAATGYVNAVSEGLRHTQEYFSFSPQENPDTSFLGIYCPNDFKLAWTNTPTLLPGKVNLIRRTVEMLKRIDVEHETLLVNEDSKQYKKRGPSLQMVSQQYPVGVSIARIYPADSQKPVTGKTTGTEIPSPPQIMVNSAYKGNGSPPQIMIGSGYDSGDVATTKPSRDDSDFNPVQDITLTLSTVLNSADTLDRVEYVSTFIYVYPYQKPSNKDVSLGNEFWKKFFAIQSGRFDISIRDGARIIDRTIAEDSIEMDLRRAFEAMAFRFQNVTTTVVTKDLDLGTVSRGTEDTLTAAIGATIPVGPAAINPSLAASSKDTSSVVMKLLRQLDQRSTYISQNADFLRITQRGMSSANLAGRFNEQLQLYIPPAQETLQVLAPYSEDTQQKAGPASDQKKVGPAEEQKQAGEKAKIQEPITNLVTGTPIQQSTTNLVAETPRLGLRIRSLAKPLYNQINAAVVSVVVVRHPTKLRRSKLESFGLSQDDAADTDFIVGLPRPSRVTLWKWDRALDAVYASELCAGFAKMNQRIYFDCPSVGMDKAAPLYLLGFDKTQSLMLRGKISKAIRHEENRPKDTDKQPNKDPLRDLEVPALPTNTNYFITVNDKFSGTVIRLGLLDSASEKLRPFEQDFFPSIKQ